MGNIDTNRILEYAEELGKIPLHSIKNLQMIIDILNDQGYDCYISSDTDYLIVEVMQWTM